MLMVVTDRISFPLRVFEDTGSLVTWAHRNIIPDRNAMYDILDCALNDILGDEVPGEVVLLRLEVWKYIDGAYGGAEPLVTFNSPVELPGCKAYGGPIHGDNIIHPECDCEDCTRVDFEDGAYFFDKDRSIWVWRPLINPELN